MKNLTLEEARSYKKTILECLNHSHSWVTIREKDDLENLFLHFDDMEKNIESEINIVRSRERLVIPTPLKNE